MKTALSRSLAAFLLLGVLACKPKVPPAPAAAKSTIVLLPESDGRTGAISISNSGGSIDLTQSYTAVSLATAAIAPSAPFPITKAETDRIFGPALNVLGDPQRSFLIYFDVASDDFNLDVLIEVIQAIKDRASTDVSVIGHTDTTGDSASNYQLALRRAARVADALQTKGVDSAIVAVESHGDSDLLIQTARGVAESRNRRVEIVVR